MGIGGFCTYLIIKPRLKKICHYNEEVARENEEINRKNEELQIKNTELQYSYNLLREKKEELLASVYETQSQYDFLKQQADQSAKDLYDKSIALAQEKFTQAAELERQKYLEAVNDYQEQLKITMQEGVNAYMDNLAEKDSEYKELERKFIALLNSTNAAVEAAKRAEEIKQEANYYKIQLSELDQEEIRMLRNVAPYLRDKEPLNKVIWKVYYEKPTTDLIGRVIGSGSHTGIYKITNLDNQMCYVGQAVNLADRWKQHIKRGIGAETPTRNKLYPAMIAIGVENFSFEVIEECPREKLDEREDYWQDYFKAKEFGYSIK